MDRYFASLDDQDTHDGMEMSLLILYEIEGEDEMKKGMKKGRLDRGEESEGGEVSKIVLMGCEGAYVGNEGDKRYNKYIESTLCKDGLRKKCLQCEGYNHLLGKKGKQMIRKDGL
ncbi:hypothetical protein Tco_0726952 [Tanacetum coccineum]|uniref:Uncharacterized protein n=1 Tax=Tanacetum coccineum TaxID=301880 RepID=A0ABQ4YJA6_9ASTR